MLSNLVIQNIVLIDRLTLEAGSGLLALTGETGAGKSILLDALGLVLGNRAEASLVRHGQEQATVTACFDIPKSHPVRALLKEQDIELSEELILRRVINKDGRSKAFINDSPVSIQLLKMLGEELIEIHGQFETQGLLDPKMHATALDLYAGLSDDAAAIKTAWTSWKSAKDKLEQAKADIASAGLQEEYLEHAVAELEKLSPEKGEEVILTEKRRLLQNREKMAEGFSQAIDILDGENGIRALLGHLDTILERLEIKNIHDALGRAASELEDIAWNIEKLKSGDGGAENLEEIEERYFSIKECARKHRCSPDDLPLVLEELSQRLSLITHQEEALKNLTSAVSASKEKFIFLAEKISLKRQKSAQKLAKAVNAELPDLKLDKASFSIECGREEDETNWNASGFDRVQFMVSTNPKTPAGPLHKIASGGELARFMLALKVILAETGSVPTMIFDEVDSGISGATADAVGERLQRLGKKYQILVVTHSPQVAARASTHWHVEKQVSKNGAVTTIKKLHSVKERSEEIARMLSGASITKEARAQAIRLLEHHDAAA